MSDTDTRTSLPGCKVCGGNVRHQVWCTAYDPANLVTAPGGRSAPPDTPTLHTYDVHHVRPDRLGAPPIRTRVRATGPDHARTFAPVGHVVLHVGLIDPDAPEWDVTHYPRNGSGWKTRTTRVRARTRQEARACIPDGQTAGSVNPVPAAPAFPPYVYEVRYVPRADRFSSPRFKRLTDAGPDAARMWADLARDNVILSVAPVERATTKAHTTGGRPVRAALVRLVATAIDGRRPADPDGAMAHHSAAAERVVTALEATPGLVSVIVPAAAACAPVPAAERTRILAHLSRMIEDRSALADARPGSWSAHVARVEADALRAARDAVLSPLAARRTEPPLCPRCGRLKEHPSAFTWDQTTAPRCTHAFHGPITTGRIHASRLTPEWVAQGTPARPVAGRVHTTRPGLWKCTAHGIWEWHAEHDAWPSKHNVPPPCRQAGCAVGTPEPGRVHADPLRPDGTREWTCTAHGRFTSTGDGADPNEVPPPCQATGCVVWRPPVPGGLASGSRGIESPLLPPVPPTFDYADANQEPRDLLRQDAPRWLRRCLQTVFR